MSVQRPGWGKGGCHGVHRCSLEHVHRAARGTDGRAGGRLLEKAPHSGGRQKSGRFSLPGLWGNRARLGWTGAPSGRTWKALGGLPGRPSGGAVPPPPPPLRVAAWASSPHGRMVLPESQAHPLAQVPGRAWRPGLRSPTPLFAPGLLPARQSLAPPRCRLGGAACAGLVQPSPNSPAG